MIYTASLFTTMKPTVIHHPASTDYAALHCRFVAFLIDGILLCLLQSNLMQLAFKHDLSFQRITENTAIMDQLRAGLDFALAHPAWPISWVVLHWLYSAASVSSHHQATLGKLAVGIKVTCADGKPLSFFHATLRYIAKLVTTLTLGLGFLPAVFMPKRQALHDLMAGTVVTMRPH
jgi:uncharacterized RDD family membrane protein YckC